MLTVYPQCINIAVQRVAFCPHTYWEPFLLQHPTNQPSSRGIRNHQRKWFFMRKIAGPTDLDPTDYIKLVMGDS